MFSSGVLTRGQLGLVELIFQYIHCDEVNEAINTLSSMNWDTLGQQCFVSMSAIVNHLLRQRLTPEREAQLEASLGTFYAPARPLLDTTVLEYRDQISKYARRFFHHLLRYRRFEKAFLLAVDIGARDLFMDIHYLALDMGELALAEVARRRACDIDVESVSSGIEVNSENVLNVLAHKNTHLENRKATSPYNIEQCREGYETLMCVPMYLYIAELGVTVELLGPLDKRDTLNEAFAGPAPEGENTFPDLLPSTGSKHRHVIQQKIPNGPSNRKDVQLQEKEKLAMVNTQTKEFITIKPALHGILYTEGKDKHTEAARVDIETATKNNFSLQFIIVSYFIHCVI
ncbi:putative WD repeat-containing and planar cell polarity effector protein fritz like protein [Cricetulus griseus]|nr:putative WD repeat-containing and planar cell polarity effector protein fritz like protein [Cricetulus griseus]